jgi:hypothetical protein
VDAAVAAALAAIPRELVGHVAGLDPGQLHALTRMHPVLIAQAVRGLVGMDDDKAMAFGKALGNLPPSAVPLLALALPEEAKKYREANGVGASTASLRGRPDEPAVRRVERVPGPDELAGDAEVEDLHRAVFAHHDDVVGLDVAAHDAGPVRRGERPRDVAEPAKPRRGPRPAAPM